jgi:23S rRNA pseudouridine1911/1915/1917 synthase
MSIDNQIYIVPAGTQNERADKVLSAYCNTVSRTHIQKLFDSEQVWLQHKAIKKNHLVCEGDVLIFADPSVPETTLDPLDIKLDVLYEDEAIVVINKQPHIVVHPGNGVAGPTLVQAVLHHTQGQLSNLAGQLRPGIVHRLDKETSGIIVFAKTDIAYLNLIHQFSERVPEKYYIAFVKGVITKASGTLQNFITRHPIQRHKMSIGTTGRLAHTDWKVLETFIPHATLVECKIYTGRTHQIRVHMSSLRHPVLGDKTYGYTDSVSFPHPISRILLHAHKLNLLHPQTNQPLAFVAPIPEDFLMCQTILRSACKL